MSHVSRNASPYGEASHSHVKIFVEFIAIIILTCYLLPVTCYPQVSSADLINNAKQYDGKTVSYQGEVIGDVMVRGNNAWINLNDTKNAIGIWLAADITKEISYTGSYKSKGDIISVEGIFHRSCLEHGGDLDIHAKSTKLITKGYGIEESISPIKIRAVITFLIICLTLAVIYFIRLGYGSKR